MPKVRPNQRAAKCFAVSWAVSNEETVITGRWCYNSCQGVQCGLGESGKVGDVSCQGGRLCVMCQVFSSLAAPASRAGAAGWNYNDGQNCPPVYTSTVLTVRAGGADKTHHVLIAHTSLPIKSRGRAAGRGGHRSALTTPLHYPGHTQSARGRHGFYIKPVSLTSPPLFATPHDRNECSVTT